MSMRARRRRRNRSSVGRKLLLSAAVVGGVLAAGALGIGIWTFSVIADTPSIDELEPFDHGQNSQIYDSDGQRLGFIASDEVRNPISLRNMPIELQQATMAIEDANFYEHDGVDLGAIVRAAFRNAEAGRTVEGGSTITQQLVRNLYITNPERDLQRKIREAKLASELEDRLSKDQILEQYLNTASYGTTGGRTSIGVEAAARTYFSKPARDLELTEAAMIAGLPQAPSIYNPLLNPKAATQRRNSVLAAMAEQGYISEAEAKDAIAKGLGLEPSDRFSKVREPFFFDFVEQQLIEEFGVNTVRQGGLKVFTTINTDYQEAARNAINSNLNVPGDPASAVVTIDPENGRVLAMASSASYDERDFNLAAQGHRQPGSAFKTMVLAAAIREGINPNTTYYASKPLSIDDPVYGHWEVSTYSNSYSGSISLARATLSSDNTVYAQLALDVGPDDVRQTAYDLGIQTELDAYPAEALGGLRLGVSPLEMASAYATLAANGVYHKPVAIDRVEFPDGEVAHPQKTEPTEAMEDWQAYEVTKILEQNVLGGTGTAANIGCPAAGKTGTTDDFKDAWFVGYTPDKSTAVWVGHPDANIPMTSVHGISVAGGTFPAQIWHDYMAVAIEDECNDWTVPSTTPSWTTFRSRYKLDDDDITTITTDELTTTEETKKKKNRGGGTEEQVVPVTPPSGGGGGSGGGPSPSPPSPPSGGGGGNPGGGNPGGGNPGGGNAGGDIPGAGGVSPG